MPCNKIDKPLVIYRFLGTLRRLKQRCVHYDKIIRFKAEMRFQSDLNVI